MLRTRECSLELPHRLWFPLDKLTTVLLARLIFITGGMNCKTNTLLKRHDDAEASFLSNAYKLLCVTSALDVFLKRDSVRSEWSVLLASVSTVSRVTDFVEQ